MSSARTFMKLTRCLFASTHNQLPVSRFFSNATKYTREATSLFSNRYAASAGRVPCISSSFSRSSHHQSDGDKDLIKFLKEEISYEQENVKEIPKLKGFKIKMDGSLVTLTKELEEERVEVKFDVNDNLNVDDGESMNDDQVADDTDEEISDIVSYPTFTVTVRKPSGNTLLFNCNCNTGINEDEEMDDNSDDEQYDILRFDSVQLFNENTGTKNIYEAETEHIDGELYSMLMNFLLERGINGSFVNDLIDLSTSVEHRHYLSFLKSLERFVAEH